jgi:hypothetical protein
MTFFGRLEKHVKTAASVTLQRSQPLFINCQYLPAKAPKTR